MSDSQISVFDAMYRTIASEIEQLHRARVVVRLSKLILEAQDKQLDKLGSVFDVERQTAESDDLYRIRIQSAFHSLLVSGTLQEIKDGAATLIQDDVDRIDITEPDGESAQIEVQLYEALFAEREMTADQFFDELDALAAGGVDIRGLEKGTFMFAEGTTPITDADRGFGTTSDESIGGTWSTILR